MWQLIEMNHEPVTSKACFAVFMSNCPQAASILLIIKYTHSPIYGHHFY